MHNFELGLITLLAPLLGFIFTCSIAFHREKICISICVLAALVSFIGSVFLLINMMKLQQNINLHFFEWIKSTNIIICVGMLVDSLSAAMMVVVSFISLLVHVYSIAYMADEYRKTVFFAYLNLFTFMMLLLVSAPNMLQMFCGWEGVGLASYLLIGFWYEKESAAYSAIKAFVINRVGDVGFVIAIGGIFLCFNTLDFGPIFAKITTGTLPAQYLIDIICIALLVGAMGKSGQFGLHTWLPDAMEAPTPVSALLHAATMVTAGVFLIVRLSPLIEHSLITKNIMMVVGAITGLLAGSIALVQRDIKKVIAYSTCSQLGMMFMACAAGAYSFAFFHLFTHAFFKALLFLGAGAVIHALSHEQNIEHMGGLKKFMPFTYIAMLIGTLAITGVPFFAGYYSKDLIFEAIYAFSFNAYVACLVIAFFTSLYSWRLIFLVFTGKNRSDEQLKAHIHSVEILMKIPMGLLAICSVIMGMVGYKFFITKDFSFAWNGVIVEHTHFECPYLYVILPFVAAVLGFGICFYIYVLRPNSSMILADKFSGLHKLLFNKYFFDEMYEFLIQTPCKKIGDALYHFYDRKIIDRYGPDGIGQVALKSGNIATKLQTGYVNNYVLWAVMGLGIILGCYLMLQNKPYLASYLKILIGDI